MQIPTRRAATILLALFCLMTGRLQATPTERLEGKFLKSRMKLRLDEDWKVQTGNVPGAEAVAFDDSAWATTSVPHDMSITLVCTTNYDPGALGWYRKHFTLPRAFAGKQVVVQFDGVYQDSAIYLNGTRVGGQRFGYISFYCDLTPYLNATGDNVLAVYVDNQTARRSHFYSGTGIYRHVWLIATDQVHIRNWGTAVTTPAVAAAQSVRHVVFRAVYTEVNARMQAEAMRLGTPTFLNAEEAAAAAKTNDALVDRPWALWKQRAMGKT